MKNKTLLLLIFALGIFFFSTPVFALTKINFEEAGNGQIDTTLHFEEGFVGGIDITFRVTGDVYVQDFQFSNKIASGNYNKEFQYDSNAKTLTVRVTTGGIGTSHNLLNEKKELALGTISFATSSQENVSYQLSETAFKIVDNNWASQMIEQSHITLGDHTSFVYQVGKVTPPVEEPEEEDPKQEEQQQPSENQGQSNNQNTNQNENQNNVTDEKNPSSSGQSTLETGENETSPDSTEIEEDTDSSKEEEKNPSSSEEKKEEEKSFSIIPYVIIACFLVVGIGIYLFFLKRKKEEESSL